jgi:NitT/TauT family transport system substrate-binding protein
MRTSPLSFLLVVALSLTACNKSGETPPPQVAPEKVTIAQFGHVFLYLPLYVARAKGFFTEQGLDVSLVDTGGDDKTFAAVGGGSAQFGVADPVFAAIAREQGKGGKVIASLVNGVPFWGVTFRKDLQPITNAKQFANLRIATYPSPSTNYAVMADTLKHAKVTDATVVQGAFGSLLAIAKANQADVVMELEPMASIAVADGGSIVYSAAKSFGDFAFTGITTTDDLLARKPAQAQAVVNAIAKAMTWVHSDFEGAISIAKAEFPEVPETVLRSALRRLLDEGVIPSSPVVGEKAWANAVSLRQSLGDLKGNAPFADNVEMRFASKVKQ